MTQSAEQLREQHGGVWGHHPDYPVSDWQYLVANDDTRQGYWDWVSTELEFAAEETDPSSGK